MSETGKLTADVSPIGTLETTVTWSSDNETVATVDSSGVVTAKSVGTATIKAVTTNGKEDSIQIEVIPCGCGGEYRQVDTAELNCFGYALFLENAVNPNPLFWPDSHRTEDFSDKIEGVLTAYCSKYRRICSYMSDIDSDEYRIALRFPNGIIEGINYHVIYQLNNGAWAGKDYTAPSKFLGYGNPSETPSMWENNRYSEEAGTIYYAIKLR